MNVISVLSGHFDDRRRENAGQAGEERIRYWRAENCRSRKRKTGEGGGSCSGTPTVRPVSITFPPSTFVKKPPVWISRMLQELTLNKNLLPSMNLCIETLNFMETGEMKFASCIFWLYVTVEKLFISYLYTANDSGSMTAEWCPAHFWMNVHRGSWRQGGWLAEKPHNSMNHIQSHICHLRCLLEFRKQIYL